MQLVNKILPANILSGMKILAMPQKQKDFAKVCPTLSFNKQSQADHLTLRVYL
jgi:hypothetical protein